MLVKNNDKHLKLEVEILIKEFKDIVKSFYIVQKKFLFHTKKNPLKNEPTNYEVILPRKSRLLGRVQTILSEAPAPTDDSEAGPSGIGTAPQIQQQVQSSEFKEVPENLEDLEKREQEFRQIETDMNDINALMREMGQMVVDQGETILKIDETVEETAETVESTVELLQDARKSTDRRRYAYVTIASLVLLVTLIIILIKIL